MTWNINGLMVIPQDPQLTISPLGSQGSFFNFKGVTQGKKSGDKVDYQYWDCSLFIPTAYIEEWQEHIKPSTVFYIESAIAESIPVLEGKYYRTRIKLDMYKTKKMKQPLWIG